MTNAPNASDNIAESAVTASPKTDATKEGTMPEDHADIDSGEVRDETAAAANAADDK